MAMSRRIGQTFQKACFRLTTGSLQCNIGCSASVQSRFSNSCFLTRLQCRSKIIIHGMQVLAHLDVLLPSLFDALHAPSERVVVEALSVQAAIAADDPQQFRTLMRELIDRWRSLFHSL